MKHTINHRHTSAVLFQTDLPDDTHSVLATRAALENAVKAGANLVGANLARAKLDGAKLDGANLAWANLAGAYIAGANLDGANLDGAYLAGAYLAGANLAGAYLAGANLVGANLDGANLDGAKLDGAKLDGAKLAWAKLDGAKLGDKTLTGFRPVLMIGPIGSRSDYLMSYMTDCGIVLKAGCFTGTVDEFRAKLAQTHGENKHAREYAAALVMIEAHAAIWTTEN
jgi:hypothetical protein